MVKNPLAKPLAALVRHSGRRYSKGQLAQKLGLSRRGLYNAMSPDKEFATFKASTLISVTKVLPITIQISDGKVKVIRWDIIEGDD